MSEYWKSTGKKYCDFCKCWTADNKASIDFHERGKNHQANVQRRLGEKFNLRNVSKVCLLNSIHSCQLSSQIKKNSIAKRKKDEASQKMFDEMEKAALVAVQKDISGNGAAIGKSDLKKIVSAHATGTTTNSGSETYPWTEMKAPQGFTYYYNCLTGESSWSMPEVFKNKKEKEERDKRDAEIVPSKTYYHNDKKKRSPPVETQSKHTPKQIVEEVEEEEHNVHPLLGGWSTVRRYEVESDENTGNEDRQDENAGNEDKPEHTTSGCVVESSEVTTLEQTKDKATESNEPEQKSGKRFKEKVITSTLTASDEPVAFKKRKSKIRSTRKRDDDD